MRPVRVTNFTGGAKTALCAHILALIGPSPDQTDGVGAPSSSKVLVASSTK